MIFFSILHADATPKDLMLMAVSSFTTFLQNNKADLHLVLQHWDKASAEVPPDLRCLVSTYKGRVALHHSHMPQEASQLTWYASRFSKEVGDLLGGGKLVYMDYDLYHLSPIEGSLESDCDWERLNMSIDLSGYVSEGSPALRSAGIHGRPYYNTGFAAWTHGANEALEELSNKIEWSQHSGDSQYEYADQGALNEVLKDNSHLVHCLPSTYNFPVPGQSELEDITRLVYPCKSIGVKIVHVMSYHKDGVSSRVSPFRECPRSEHWYVDSALPMYGRSGGDIHIVVISHNQAKSLPPMGAYLRDKFPGCPVTVVLDRCSDNSIDMARIAGFSPVLNFEGVGFLAGRMRDKGLAASGMHDTIFLDGDRIPSMQFGYQEACKALAKYDLTLLPIKEGEFREWFQDECFVDNKHYGEWGNDFFTCGLIARKSALESLTKSQDGLLFVKDFDGQFGEEDRYLGDLAHALDLTCGGAPRKYALSGSTFRPCGERTGVERNVAIRHKLRGLLGYTTDRIHTKEALRSEALSKLRSEVGK